VSASYLVDLNNTTQQGASLFSTPILSGACVCPSSGAQIGLTIDMINSDSYCNLFAGGVSASGQLRLQVQCSDSDVSGNFTDPTSGLAQFPTAFASGGILWINSGGAGNGVLGGFASGQCIASGWFGGAAFVRTGRFARVNALNEGAAQYGGALVAGFVSQLKTTGSGGGFSYQPSSGSVSV